MRVCVYVCMYMHVCVYKLIQSIPYKQHLKFLYQISVLQEGWLTRIWGNLIIGKMRELQYTWLVINTVKAPLPWRKQSIKTCLAPSVQCSAQGSSLLVLAPSTSQMPCELTNHEGAGPAIRVVLHLLQSLPRRLLPGAPRVELQNWL